MKKTSTLAPLLIGSLVAMLQLTSAPEARAFGGAPGGPFTNGSYFPNDGTFSAVVRGENLSGTVQFSTTAGSGQTGAGSTGVSTIYYDGDTYLGNSQGSYNPQASTMEVNFQADVQGQGEKSIKVKTGVTGLQALPLYGINGNIVGYTTVNATSYLDTTEVYYFDSLYLNGYANCKTSNAFPNQKFSGSGEAQFQQLNFSNFTPFLDFVTVPISVTGVRLSNTSTTFATSEVRPPSVNEFSVLIE
jgi:hypothetical protein